MTDVSFNSAPVSLIEPGNSVSVWDQNFDGDSDQFAIYFEGADGRSYELIGEADPQHRQWGRGSSYALYDSTGVDRTLLARYEISEDGYPTPVYAQDGPCTEIGYALIPSSYGTPTLTLPDGSILRIRTPLDRLDSAQPATRVELLTAEGGPWIEFLSEGRFGDGPAPTSATVTEVGYDSSGLSKTDKTQPHLERRTHSWN